MIGQTIAHYKVTAKLGAGGMGEVYRATDTKLGRDVALKVLPEAFAQDAQRMQRFQREAQVLASLNHSNIAAIYGLEESRASRALAMELVEGPTLADRIARGAIPVDEALPIAKQIAEALEYAHEKGIIHRDLKPANIKLTPDRAVKVLDFGLAKALQDDTSPQDISNSPTLSVAATKAGLILGTAAYMSPEQAKGKAVDRRADIWAFGVVLFELFSGRGLYEGGTASETLAAVILKDPPLDQVPASVPPHIRQLIARCLRKDPRSRLQSIGDARVILEEGASLQAESALLPAVASPAATAHRSLLPWAAAGLLVVALGVAAAGWWRASLHVAQPVTRFPLDLPGGVLLPREYQSNLAFSADGTRIAYVVVSEGQKRIYLRALDQLAPSPVAGTEGATAPAFSPDGQWLAFVAGGFMKKVQMSTGTLINLGASTDNRGITWLADGSIVFAPEPTGPLFRIPAHGGAAQPLTTLDATKRERTHRWPSPLPGGKLVLFTVGTLDSEEYYDDSNIEAVEIATGKRLVVLQGASMARYVPATGHLIYAQTGTLFAVPFDVERLQTRGPATPVVQGVLGVRSSGVVYFTISDNGSLAYLPGATTGEERRIVRYDREGKVETLPAPPRDYGDIVLSPDGRQAAFAVSDSRTSDIWVYDLRRNTLNRLTFGPGMNSAPLWMPDGRHIVFLRDERNGKYSLCRKAADGSGAVEVLFDSPVPLYPNSVSPDGKQLSISSSPSTQNASDISLLSVADGNLQPFVDTPADEYGSELSPDGRWISYLSSETGQIEVYVRPASGAGGRWQISNGGGVDEARWSSNGKEIFFRAGLQLMVVPVDTRDGFHVGTPRKVLDSFPSLGGAGTSRTYAVSRDGKNFYSTGSSLAGVSSAPVVVVNWGQELRSLTSAGKQ